MKNSSFLPYSSLKKGWQLLFLALLLVFSENLLAQEISIRLNWLEPQKVETGSLKLYFEGAIYPEFSNNLPHKSKRLDGLYNATLSKYTIERLSKEEFQALNSNFDISSDFKITVEHGISRKQPSTTIYILPIRKNATTGNFEKLVDYSLFLNPTSSNINQRSAPRIYAANSVLSTGKWAKISLAADGVYKVDYNFLINAGLDPSTFSLQSIKLFGNGGGMVPMPNSNLRADDLKENAIEVVDANNNGTFESGDYFLFYGQGPDRWQYKTSEKRYVHAKNLFSDSTYYFISTDLPGNGKRIASLSNQNGTPATLTINTFTDYIFAESDKNNFIKSGRNWYGDAFDVSLTQSFDFNFPNLVAGTAKLKSSVISRTSTATPATSRFNISYAGTPILTQTISNVGTSYTSDFANANVNSATFQANSPAITLNYTYVPFNSTATGWLDYIELNATRRLQFSGNQVIWRDLDTVNIASNRLYVIDNISSGLKIWNVTDPTSVGNQEAIKNGNSLSFQKNLGASEFNEYILFEKSNIKIPTFSNNVSNQDLHALTATDFIIVTHPDFVSEAERLAAFRRENDNLRVTVATTEQIYNEFSSGQQDISGIRDFVKMFYDRATTPADQPRYLLLFGDGSYDLKNRIGGNTNYVPTFQSENSISLINSYTCDDFFGMMDDNEGSLLGGELVDIGIGRIPVRDLPTAKLMVDKVITYATPGSITDQTYCGNSNSTRFGDWRNNLCFIADDQDGNLHFRQNERIINSFKNLRPNYNIDKIVLDAYTQQSTPGGQRYPEVNEAIDKRIEKGTFLMNYTGHGGELGWAAEAVLNIDMINSWRNVNSMPAFITATCEFSRYDDPKRTSAGELVLLNSSGGGICLFTTVRLAFAIDNEVINTDMMRYLFEPINGEMPRVGDIQRLAKRENSGNRNVTLLGDPSVRLTYPKYNVVTTSIEETGTGIIIDTLKALSKVTVKGKVTDSSGNLLSGFNGVVYPTIYDKNSNILTLVNDSQGDDISRLDSFLLRKNILYKGKSSVKNGVFSCSFIVPKDISFQYGQGRLSYYAFNQTEDAAGNNELFQIGGISNNIIADAQGPQIKLYLNDENFVQGGMTDQTPAVFAILFDSSGINTVGNGIGHDITAIVDNDQQNLFVLNDYYESELDSYQKGRVRYKLSSLPAGPHTLVLKAWDINGNSSDAVTEFVVSESASLALDHVLNYPNPFSTKTSFFFEHNKPCQGLSVQVQVYTVSGKLVKTINNYQICEGYRNSAMEWDGKDDYGDQLAKGVYIYRLRIKSAEGETAEKLERLVLLR
jgi:hypothetical protein